MTLTQIFSKLEKEGKEFTAYCDGVVNQMIGIKFSAHCWTWYYICGTDDNTFFVFHHRYSQNTGIAAKGKIARKNANNSIAKIIYND